MRRDGKLQKNAYSPIIHALDNIGVKINRDTLHKCVERAVENRRPVKFWGDNEMTDLSSIT